MEIHILSDETINKIAAGEVVERPVNVAKELIENAIDAGSTAISIEIRDGGVTLLRVTDNGCGIEPDQITKAFRRHATSKITEEEDLTRLSTLGFRGEALSSIASVAEVEMITKVRGALTGIRAINTGLAPNNTDVIPLEISEIGAPDGTTVIVRNLFYNVPVRRKFLKTAATEAGYISDLCEHMALSHPNISFHYRVNGKEKLHTSGNGNIKEIIYRIYGREIVKTILPVDESDERGDFHLKGFIGRPEISRGTRSFEIFFVNGRILESNVLSRGLESGYRTDLMQHQFPFAILYLELPQIMVDVNVHPSKKEVRFSDAQRIYNFLDASIHKTLHREELIPKATLRSEAEIRNSEAEEKAGALSASHREPFEKRTAADASYARPIQQKMTFLEERGKYTASLENASAAVRPSSAADSGCGKTAVPGSASDKVSVKAAASILDLDTAPAGVPASSGGSVTIPSGTEVSIPGPAVSPASTAADIASNPDPAGVSSGPAPNSVSPETTSASTDDPYRFYDDDETAARILTAEKAASFEIIGQIFDTYWIISSDDRMLLIDQHAAHEKVRFERLMKQYRERMKHTAPSQNLLPPRIISLSGKEEACYIANKDVFEALGYEMEEFGGGSYAIRAVPLELYGTREDELLRNVIDEMLDGKMSGDPSDIVYRLATISCKGAIKGNMKISLAEAKELIAEMLIMDNPYHCPHGRPTCIILTEQEIEKKFKRIV